MKKYKKNQKGFTLIEILVVIGIIAILAAVVIIAINPARQFAQARNSQRWSNINAILNSVGQRLADNRGVWTQTATCNSGAIPSTSTIIGTGVGNFNLEVCVVPTYLPSMLVDPGNGTLASTGYSIQRDVNGRITISAPGADWIDGVNPNISVVR